MLGQQQGKLTMKSEKGVLLTLSLWFARETQQNDMILRHYATDPTEYMNNRKFTLENLYCLA